MPAFGGVAVHVGRLPGVAVVEARAVRAMRHGQQLVGQLGGGNAVQGQPVSAHHRSHVERLLVAAFDLERVDAGRGQVVKVRQHVEVLRGHDIGSAHVLLHGKELAGTLLLHQRVAPPARLGAMALVAGAAGERGADQAAARHGHAHGAVHERLQLQLARGAGAQSRDVLHAHLPRAHHAARAQLVPYARRLGVAHRGLGTHVQLDVRRVPLSQAQRAQVAHDERVDAGRGKRFEVRGKRLEVVGVHEGVQRHVRLRARIVHESCRSGNVVQREVRRALPQPEPIGGQVHGVRTEAQRGLQLRKPARGREELGSPCRLSSHAPYCSASANPRAGDHRNPSLRAGQRPYLAILRISEPCGTFPSLSHPIAFPSWT